jgi:hypothetical protein
LLCHERQRTFSTPYLRLLSFTNDAITPRKRSPFIYLCLKSVWMKIFSFSVSNISCPVSVFHSESHSSNYGRVLQSLQGKLNFLHTSHKINQLEILFCGPLKPAFNTECTPYVRYHSLRDTAGRHDFTIHQCLLNSCCKCKGFVRRLDLFNEVGFICAKLSNTVLCEYTCALVFRRPWKIAKSVYQFRQICPSA